MSNRAEKELLRAQPQEQGSRGATSQYGFWAPRKRVSGAQQQYTSRLTMALENWESEHEPGDDEDVGEEEVGEDDGDGSGDDDDVGEHDGDGSSGASSGDTSEHDGNGDGSGYDGGPGSKRKRKMRKEFFPAYFLAANTGESSVDHFKRGVDPILIQNDARYKNTKHGRASTMDARLKIAFYKS